jgi:hypothetical protein
VVDALKALDVNEAELQAIRFSAERIEEGARSVLRGGPIYDFSPPRSPWKAAADARRSQGRVFLLHVRHPLPVSA